jgi:two-component system, NarL family, response regulator NreC
MSADPLTEREKQIVRLITEDRSIKEIAFALGIASKTVQGYRQSIKTKLAVKGVAGMVRYAIRMGMIDP